MGLFKNSIFYLAPPNPPRGIKISDYQQVPLGGFRGGNLKRGLFQ
jgi:hypothetical protein